MVRGSSQLMIYCIHLERPFTWVMMRCKHVKNLHATHYSHWLLEESVKLDNAAMVDSRAVHVQAWRLASQVSSVARSWPPRPIPTEWPLQAMAAMFLHILICRAWMEIPCRYCFSCLFICVSVWLSVWVWTRPKQHTFWTCPNICVFWTRPKNTLDALVNLHPIHTATLWKGGAQAQSSKSVHPFQAE